MVNYGEEGRGRGRWGGLGMYVKFVLAYKYFMYIPRYRIESRLQFW